MNTYSMYSCTIFIHTWTIELGHVIIKWVEELLWIAPHKKIGTLGFIRRRHGSWKILVFTCFQQCWSHLLATIVSLERCSCIAIFYPLPISPWGDLKPIRANVRMPPKGQLGPFIHSPSLCTTKWNGRRPLSPNSHAFDWTTKRKPLQICITT